MESEEKTCGEQEQQADYLLGIEVIGEAAERCRAWSGGVEVVVAKVDERTPEPRMAAAWHGMAVTSTATCTNVTAAFATARVVACKANSCVSHIIW
jgi:hypothetical protein